MNQKCDNKFSVSVVIPAYNAELVIRRAVDSVLAQTRPADEIIVVDDGSTDTTGEILDQYGDKIIAIHQQNAGASIARNNAIKRASGKWIAFLDADDEWLPSLLERLVGILEDHQELVWSYSNYWFCYYDSDRVRIAFQDRPCSDDIVKDYLLVHSKYCIRPSASIIKKSVLCDSGLFLSEQKWVHDADLFLRIAYNHPEIGYIHEPLARYFCDLPDSLTSKYCFLADELCILVERHLLLSQECNRQKELIQCMSEKIPYWVSVALQHKKYNEARIMLKRMGHLVPMHRRWKLVMDAYFPFLRKITDTVVSHAGIIVKSIKSHNL